MLIQTSLIFDNLPATELMWSTFWASISSSKQNINSIQLLYREAVWMLPRSNKPKFLHIVLRRTCINSNEIIPRKKLATRTMGYNYNILYNQSGSIPPWSLYFNWNEDSASQYTECVLTMVLFFGGEGWWGCRGDGVCRGGLRWLLGAGEKRLNREQSRLVGCMRQTTLTFLCIIWRGRVRLRNIS